MKQEINNDKIYEPSWSFFNDVIWYAKEIYPKRKDKIFNDISFPSKMSGFVSNFTKLTFLISISFFTSSSEIILSVLKDLSTEHVQIKKTKIYKVNFFISLDLYRDCSFIEQPLFIKILCSIPLYHHNKQQLSF